MPKETKATLLEHEHKIHHSRREMSCSCSSCRGRPHMMKHKRAPTELNVFMSKEIPKQKGKTPQERFRKAIEVWNKQKAKK
jgi:hypothetical protein